ncbi:MFS transporter [Nonomuraea sp. M3C6]|uniref:MFS transporter n=1 Tax=Nonomuraea marmarensis TaxID=3351344 RepID=A0ABW7AXN0_9ACTN
MLAGPVVGGVLTSAFGWPAIFFINLPVDVIALVTLTRTPRSIPRPAPLDLTGQTTAIAGLAALTFAVIEAGAHGWTSPRVATAPAVFALAALPPPFHRGTHTSPMVPLGLFRSRTVSVTITTGLVLNLAFYGLVFALSLYFQQNPQQLRAHGRADVHSHDPC